MRYLILYTSNASTSYDINTLTMIHVHCIYAKFIQDLSRQIQQSKQFFMKIVTVLFSIGMRPSHFRICWKTTHIIITISDAMKGRVTWSFCCLLCLALCTSKIRQARGRCHRHPQNHHWNTNFKDERGKQARRLCHGHQRFHRHHDHTRTHTLYR